jgi:TolA-binding protein
VSDHVTNDIADYIEGRLDPDRENLVRAHVEGCADCAAELALALQLQEQGAARGMRHLDAERIAAVASDSKVQMTELERQHVSDCERCRSDFELASTVPPEDEWDAIVSATDTAKRKTAHTKPWFLSWKLVPAALAAVVAVVLFIIVPSDKRDFSHLAQIEPLPVHISRGAVTPGSFEALRRRGLELYRDGQYAGARDQLTRANEMQPDAEVQLYLGSIELLLDNAEVAIPVFEMILDGAPRNAIRAEALWQLANVQLITGQTEHAGKILQELIALGEKRGNDARVLLENLQQ